MRRGLLIFIKRFKVLVLIVVCWIALNCVLLATGFLIHRPPGGTKTTKERMEKTGHLQNLRKARAANLNFFVFSVIAINTSQQESYDIFTVNTWVKWPAASDDIYCCYLLSSGKTVELKHSGINQRSEMFNMTAQVECPNPTKINEFGYLKVTGVTLSEQYSCTNENNFVVPQYPIKQMKPFSFAVCGKLIYGDVNLALTIEWMEYYKYLGVKKVILYPYKLSVTGSKLLQYYRSIGFIDVVHFTMPPSADSTAYLPGMKTTEAWNIEQLIVYDCQSRLRGYQYVAVVDLDEFIVPVTDKNFQGMMNKLLYLVPNMSAVEVYGEMFILDWTPTNKAARLVVAQYEKRTVSKSPVDINQRKLIHIPDRVMRGSVVTHGCKALNSSYSIFKDPLSVMTINHYRKCVHFRDDCFTRTRVMDKRIIRFSSKIESNVLKVKQKLNKM